jgi:DNA polymerase III subunit alpha
MRIAQVLAGISLAEADVLRKAVGKKDAELIKKELGKFETKAVAKGFPPKVIDDSPRRSRPSVATASTSRTRSRTRPLVPHGLPQDALPAEFMAALLSASIGDTDAVVKYINEARDLSLEILAPDVNESGWKFTVVGDTRIRFGLGAIRNVGHSADREHHRGAQREAVLVALRPLRARGPARVQQARVRGADPRRRARRPSGPPRTVPRRARRRDAARLAGASRDRHGPGFALR